MGSVAILTDSNSGISQDEAKKLGVFVIPTPFYIDGKLYYEGIDLGPYEFFSMQAEDRDITTSMPIVGEVMNKFDEILKDFDELVYIPLSSGLSSSCQTATMLAEDDYEGRVWVADNQRISVTQKLSVYEAKALADQGKSGEEIRDYLVEHKKDSSIYIMVDTLKYLKKGGRLTPAVAAIGTLLHIKPVLQIQGDKLDTFAKARTLKQSKEIMIEAISKDFTERFKEVEGEEIISIAHTENQKEAEIFKSELEELYPNKHIIIDPLSLVVSVHIGPGSLAVTASKSFVEL